jgi:hypothetical protein
MNKPIEPSIKNAVVDDWYKEDRQRVEAVFLKQNALPGSVEAHNSPSGQYRLVVHEYDEGGLDYSRGLVSRGDRPVAEVQRNDSRFFFSWAEGHSNGHDYLLCGEHLYGQTIIELDTGRRVDFITEDARDENSFICTAYYPSPDRRLVMIYGCYWACPFELVFCRFNDPMALPWPEIDRAELNGEPTGWTDQGFVYESSEEIRMTDLKAYHELPEDEQKELRDRRKEIGGRRFRRWTRSSDGVKVLLGERIVRNAE